MYPPGSGEYRSAAAAGTEGRAVGLALRAGVFVLNADALGHTAAIDGVVLAGNHIAADAGIGAMGFLFAHEICLP